MSKYRIVYIKEDGDIVGHYCVQQKIFGFLWIYMHATFATEEDAAKYVTREIAGKGRIWRVCREI